MAILEAIGIFFATIFKGIAYGIYWFFKAIVIGICAVAKFLWWLICTIVMLAIKYFFVYLPVLVIGGFVIFWIFNPEGPDVDIELPMSLLLNEWNYDFNLTNAAVEWMENTEENILFLIIVLIKLALVIVSAVAEFIFVYILFGLVGSIIVAAISFVVVVIIWLVLPAAGAVYSCIMLKNSEYHNRWFYLLCAVLTIIAAVICYVYAIPAID